MLHGRTGLYSTGANGTFTAQTLSRRHTMWGAFWSKRGYTALLVDSFGPRGHVQGFPRKSYASRPPEVSERNVRPLDAYGALAWLRGKNAVRDCAVGLQGWSNGAMSGLWAMSGDTLKRLRLKPRDAFRAALVFYPGCASVSKENPEYQPNAPVMMLLAGKDEEVNPTRCETFATGIETGDSVGHFDWHAYSEAGHSFDHPDKIGPADAQARADAKFRADRFFEKHVKSAT
jgi:dienelactone hydrolase